MMVYVGGSSQELGRVRGFQARVKEAGHEITFDWTELVANNLGQYTLADMLIAARSDHAAVVRADAFVGLWPKEPIVSLGLLTEIGMALELTRLRGAPPIVVGAPAEYFFRHLCSNVPTEAQAMRLLGTYA